MACVFCEVRDCLAHLCSTNIYCALTKCFWTMMNIMDMVPALMQLIVCGERGINKVSTQNENIITSFDKCHEEKKWGAMGRNNSVLL